MFNAIFTPNKTNSYAWMNLVLLVLLLFLGKIEPYTILFGYFVESIIIGVFSVLKMVAASRYDGSEKSILFYIIFFIFHYGIFIAVQSVFVFAILTFGGFESIKEPFYIIENYQIILQQKGMEYIIPLLIATQLLKFIFDFMEPKKYLQFSVQEIMLKPYVRIIIQQFTVILAMFFIVFTNASVVAALLLIFFRAVVDLVLTAIREDANFLDFLVNKFYDGKISKEKIRKQLLLFSE